MKVILRRFYERDVVDVARDLLGKLLVREVEGKRLVGRIVEVEAYRGRDDPASHAYRGRTKRNEVMFGKPGLAYIYLAYGVNWCLNITSEPEGEPAAVLIRAVEPLEGIEEMMANRQVSNLKNLTNGPGKLTKAFKIDGSLNGWDVTKGEILYIVYPDEEEEFEIGVSARIGIKFGLDKPWRFFIKNNPFVSR
mgnify:FL=1